MRRHGKIDDNHTAVVKALRACGCSVQSLASLGAGVPDLLVARNGKMWLLEIKDGRKAPSQQRLTEDQIQWRIKWKAPVHLIHSVDEALAVIV